MKVVALVLYAVVVYTQAASLTEEQQQKLLAHHQECAKTSGVTKEVLQAAKSGPYPDDDKFRTHLFCVSKRAGFVNEAGELQKSVIVAKANTIVKNEDQVNKLIEKCIVKKETTEKSVVAAMECFRDNTKGALNLL